MYKEVGKWDMALVKHEGKKHLVLGDSTVQNVGTEHSNMTVECFPGIRTEQLYRFIENRDLGSPDTVLIHVDTNDLIAKTPGITFIDLNSWIEHGDFGSGWLHLNQQGAKRLVHLDSRLRNFGGERLTGEVSDSTWRLALAVRRQCKVCSRHLSKKIQHCFGARWRGTKRIPEVSSSKYLGLIFLSDLTWADQANYTVQKAWKALHFIVHVLKKGNSNTNSLA
jgi:hypothetical protein